MLLRRDLSMERLPNGYVLVRDRASGFQGLWETNGEPMHGDLTRTTSARLVGLVVRDRFGGRS